MNVRETKGREGGGRGNGREKEGVMRQAPDDVSMSCQLWPSVVAG